ncbi:ATP-binding protein [Halogeometricum limi]|uniref:histidine kinase n=1 Tax=Halogeometricum limi TaxID=555875 RepID=A0A1I6GLX3_9EURY|nr:ATP-binding protein [Halogeometricum limi]SFR43156.1 PAS domain S-box-containing protein [Halogeometricum limi]
MTGVQNGHPRVGVVGADDRFDSTVADELTERLSLRVERVAPATVEAESFDCLVVAGALGEIRRAAESDVTSVVALVSDPDEESIAAAFEAGATDVIPRANGAEWPLLADAVRRAVADRRAKDGRADDGRADDGRADGRADDGHDDHLGDPETILNSLFENLPVHIFVKDAERRHLRVSSAFVDDPDYLVGRRDTELGEELVSDEAAAAASEDDRRVLDGDVSILDKEEYLPSREQWNLTSKVPWHDEEGTVVGLVGVSRDITERKEAVEELERQNERLDEFASVVSHDLRNPLNVARRNLELARETGDDDRLDTVADALDRIEHIVDDVLSLARGGATVLHREPVHVADAVQEAWASVDAPDATLDVSDELGDVRCDRVRLVRLVENLLRNCVEHGHDSSEDDGPRAGPTISVGRLDDGAGFYVEDDGPGIPESEREAVFDRGYTTAKDGTGYGLAIVHDIAKAHGWQVTATTGTDGGARVEVVTWNGPSE